MSGEPSPACAYCGLPLAGSSQEHEAAYCCFGCRFAAQVMSERGAEGAARGILTRLGLAIFFSMNVMVFTLALWTQDVYADPSLSSASAVALSELYRYLSLLFSAPVMVLLALPLWDSAVADVRRGVWSSDLLIVIGVIAAFVYSAVSVLTGGRHVYFEVACMVLVAVTLGRWLEATGKQRTTEALRSLSKLLPEAVRVVGRIPPGSTSWRDFQPSPDGESNAALEAVEVGHLVRVLPGERIAIDGVIRRGQAAVDQQLVTGESEPTFKEADDVVLAGTLNLDGDLLIEVTQPPCAGALQRMVAAVEQAALAKSRWQCLADRVAAWFVPAVTLLAVLVLLWHAQRGEFGLGLMSALAVLLIACPCALGIALPMATHVAIGQAALRGIFFRGGDALERLAAVRVIGFDKTGTLTTGSPVVEQVVADGETCCRVVLERATELAANSMHALSTAIRRYAEEQGIRSPPQLPEELETLPGRGISARWASESGWVDLGSPRMMLERGLSMSSRLRQAIANAGQCGCPVACVAWGGRVRGVVSFREELRESVQIVLESLRRRGIFVSVLTGDSTVRGGTLSECLEVTVHAELLPEEKLAEIQRLREQHGPIAMVGDGINDAPALAAADVGIAMGSGADVSREAADVCLLPDSLALIPWALDLARRTRRIIVENLFWAFAYNVIGVGLAACGWLSPIWAAVAMVGSSLFVVTNSLRLSGNEMATPAQEGEPSDRPAQADSPREHAQRQLEDCRV